MTGKYRSIFITTALLSGGTYLLFRLSGRDIPHMLSLWWLYLILLYTILHALEEGTDRKNTLIGLISLILLFFMGGIPFGGSLLSGTGVLALGFALLLYRRQKQVAGEDIHIHSALFSSARVEGEHVLQDGTGLFALFGELTLEGEREEVHEDIMIDATAIFAHVKIHLPPSCELEVLSTPLLGSVKNGREESERDENRPCVRVRALALFGEVSIH